MEVDSSISVNGDKVGHNPLLAASPRTSTSIRPRTGTKIAPPVSPVPTLLASSNRKLNKDSDAQL